MSTPLRERPDAPLGTLIFRAGLLPAETIENALEEGVRTGRRLGEILVERGLLKEEDLAPLLAGQKGLRFVRLDEEDVDPEAARLFAEEQARLFHALPIGFDETVPVVAVTDPTNDALMNTIQQTIGAETKLVVATLGDLTEAIGRAYGQNGSHQNGNGAEEAPLLTVPVPTPEPEPEPASEPEPEAHPAPAEPYAVSAPMPEQPAAASFSSPAEPVPELIRAPAPEPEPEEAPEPEPVSLPDPEPEQPAAVVAEAPVEATPAPVAEPPAPEPASQPEPAAGPETVLSFAPPVREPEPPRPAYRVAVKLAGDEPFLIAECTELEEAKEHAQGLIKQLADASGDEWPYVNGRFLKPDTIVSVDVERL